MRKSYLIAANNIIPDYFCVEPISGETEIKWTSDNTQIYTVSFEYSFNKLNWQPYTIGSTITSSNPVYFRGNNIRFANIVGSTYTKLVLNKQCDLSGRIGTLVKKFPKYSTNCIEGVNRLFSGNQYIHSIKHLELDLAISYTYNYSNMFNRCTSLIDTPIIKSTLVRDACKNMFEGCTSLTTIYTLPSTLARECYFEMFKDCTALTSISYNLLPATTLAQGCYYGMFKGCTSLVNACYLPATTLAVSCYRFMFQYCDSLVELPALYATELPDYCYDYMFSRKMTNSSYSYVARYTSVSSDYPAYRIPYTGTITQSYSNSIQMVGLEDTASALNNLDINTQYYLYTHKNDGDYNNITIIGIQN